MTKKGQNNFPKVDNSMTESYMIGVTEEEKHSNGIEQILNIAFLRNMIKMTYWKSALCTCKNQS